MRKFLAVFIFFIGVLLLFGFMADAYRFASSFFWNSTEGLVVSSSVLEEHCYKKCKINTAIKDCEKQQVCYRPDIVYEFSVPSLGLVKSSNFLQYGYKINRKHNRDEVESIIKEFNPGKPVTVFYELRDGKVNSCIKRHINLYFMAVVFLFSASFIFVSYKWFSGKKI